MPKKKQSRADRKDLRVEHEATVTAVDAADYLDALARGLREGRVMLNGDANGFATTVDGDVQLAVRARQGRKRARLQMRLRFSTTPPQTSQVPEEGASSVIPDEISF